MILFGTSGIPHSCKSRKSVDGVREIARLGLDLMEVEFVRGVKMGEATADKVGQAAAESGVVLTSHAPYYVNLASVEVEKVEASVERILHTASICHRFGGKSVTFHAAYYMGREPAAVMSVVTEQLRALIMRMNKEGVDLAISPELTGKPSQFGSLEELIKLSRAVEGVGLCIDWSHYVARDNGAFNSYEGFKRAIAKIRRGLGKKALSRLHMHVSGIEWTEKGEAKHRPLRESEFDWEALLDVLVEEQVSGMIVCESPLLEEDALLLKREFLKRSSSK